MKTRYYWETAGPLCGEFDAENDEQALKQKPSGATLLYKESDTPDGRPYIVLWQAAPSSEV